MLLPLETARAALTQSAMYHDHVMQQHVDGGAVFGRDKHGEWIVENPKRLASIMQMNESPTFNSHLTATSSTAQSPSEYQRFRHDPAAQLAIQHMVDLRNTYTRDFNTDYDWQAFSN